MIITLQSFAIAFGISYLGSIPPGTLNLTVIDISMRRAMQHALSFSLACALIEFIQAFIALKFSDYISVHQEIEFYIQIFVIPVFIGLGIYYLLQKEVPQYEIKQDASDVFIKGVLLSIVNPLAIPFWLVWATYLNQKGFPILDNGANMYAFILGISLGSLATLMTYAYLSKLILARITSFNKWINEIIGGILLLLGIGQAIVVVQMLGWI
jgi:threonine/homoserine/homoserine lactone efflux protein